MFTLEFNSQDKKRNKYIQDTQSEDFRLPMNEDGISLLLEQIMNITDLNSNISEDDDEMISNFVQYLISEEAVYDRSLGLLMDLKKKSLKGIQANELESLHSIIELNKTDTFHNVKRNIHEGDIMKQF
jgi:hypothetical protein